MENYFQLDPSQQELLKQQIEKRNKNLNKFATKDNEAFRRSFNELAEKTFGINFERWYQEGYWNNKYIPYSLMYKEMIVANISVNIVDVLIDGNKRRYIQIGTVMVDECYRGDGLSKVLMDKVLTEWENKCDLIYLYANDSVLDFYPKFGFEKCDEYQHSINKTKYKSIEKVILALLCSKVANMFLDIMNPTYNIQVGDLIYVKIAC